MPSETAAIPRAGLGRKRHAVQKLSSLRQVAVKGRFADSRARSLIREHELRAVGDVLTPA